MSTAKEQIKGQSVQTLCPDVFSFVFFREYLLAFYEYKKSQNPNFSYSVFAKKCGMGRTLLHAVIQGKRNLSNKFAAGVAQGCELNAWETKYFTALVMYNQCHNADSKKIYWNRLVKLAPKDGCQIIEHARQNLINRWYLLILMELIKVKGFKNDPKWIESRFGGKVTAAEIEDTIQLLIHAGFIKQDAKDVLSLANKTVYSDGTHVDGEVIRAYHAKHIPFGKDALEVIPSEKREMISVSIAYNDKNIADLKEKIRDFAFELSELSAGQAEPNEVYELNLQFFPVTEVFRKSEDDKENKS